MASSSGRAEASGRRYAHPLAARYVSREMERIFSPAFRFGTWRRLWLALAESQREMGLPIPKEAIRQMRDRLDQIDLERAADYERLFRHDVMAHVHLFGDVAPAARGVLHLGATSAFVGDNTDLIQHREAMTLVRDRVVVAVSALARFAAAHRSLPALAYTHFQPAQPTTVGKRATLWMQDFLLDLEEIEHRLGALKLRGVRGTTGTQASFLQLFEGDHAKVEQLEKAVCRRMGFDACYAATGQTYPRKVDYAFLSCLAGVAASASKAAHDVRLLAHLRELEEPFEEQQVGSSAMPYKRNPMRSERICALARHVIALSTSPAQTAATQWLERTLDDSAAKRLAVPDAYMAADAALILVDNVASGLRVNPGIVATNLARHLPFMAMESVLMEASAAGGDRQELHERIRRHALATAREATEEPAATTVGVGAALPDDDADAAAGGHASTGGGLFARIADDDAIPFTRVQLEAMARPERLVGRAPEQVDAFLTDHVAPVLKRWGAGAAQAAAGGEVRV